MDFMSDAMHNFQDLVNDFALFDNWEDRYRYLLDLAKTIPPMPDALKTEAHLIRGCTSRVWMVSRWEENETYSFLADSDAHLVRGLIGLLFILYNGKTKDEIQAIPIKHLFETIGLDQNLSPNRRNGFFSMVENIHADLLL